MDRVGDIGNACCRPPVTSASLPARAAARTRVRRDSGRGETRGISRAAGSPSSRCTFSRRFSRTWARGNNPYSITRTRSKAAQGFSRKSRAPEDMAHIAMGAQRHGNVALADRQDDRQVRILDTGIVQQE